MKLLFAVLCFTLGMAEAQALTCFDVNAGPDHGYILQFKNNSRRVLLSADSIAGPRPLAKLTCRKVKPGVVSPDEIYPVLTCSQPGLFDAGYSLIVEKGGIAGMTTATLNRISFAGSEAIASFNCH